MELAGDEKRVQALFSELLLEDQSLAPGFETLWTRAERVGPAQFRASHKSLVAIVSAVIIAGAALVGAWAWYKSTPSSTDQALNVSPQRVVTPSPELVPQPTHGSSGAGTRSHGHQKKLPRSRHLDRSATSEAALLSSWQSPTQLFMNYTAAVSLNSLPQLNQSVEELKTFLRNDAELTKESN